MDGYSPRVYEQVVCVDHADARMAVRIEVVREDATWLIGYEVDSEGARREFGKPGEWIERLHVIDKGTIRSRRAMRLSLRYATLEFVA